MSTKFQIKIKKIRKAEELTQKDFAKKCDFGLPSIKAYEVGRREPTLEILQKLCASFPQYTLYLMHEEMPLPRTEGQITPEEQQLINQGLKPEQKEG